MKSLLLLTIGSLLSLQSVVAQNLTMAQLVNIRKMDLGSATEYLSTKGWEFVEAEDETENQMGSITFAYNKSDINDNAESFLFYYFSKQYGIQRIAVQVNKKVKYNEYLTAIKGYGAKLIDSSIENGILVQTYQGKTTTFIISSSTSKNNYNVDSAIWMIRIKSNDDM